MSSLEDSLCTEAAVRSSLFAGEDEQTDGFWANEKICGAADLNEGAQQKEFQSRPKKNFTDEADWVVE